MAKEVTLYSYDISKLNNVKKVQFVYLLKGRDGSSGKIKEFNGLFIAPGCFFIPKEKSNEIDKTMKNWNVKYKKYSMLMH